MVLNVKIGLIIEGGASRSAYTCGVLTELHKYVDRFTYFMGVQTGFLSGLYYLSEQSEDAIKQFVNIFAGSKLSKISQRFEDGSYYTATNTTFSKDNLIRWKGDIFTCATECATGKPIYFRVDPYCDISRYIDAACAIPVMNTPKMVDTMEYLDGSLLDPIPVDHALNAGCTKLVIIMAKPREYVPYDGIEIKLLRRYLKKYPNLIHSLNVRTSYIKDCLHNIGWLEETGKAFIFAPAQSTQPKQFESNIEKLYDLFEYGRRDAIMKLKALDNFLP